MDSDILNKYLKWFILFQQNYNKHVCKRLFDKQGEHMWNTWNKCDGSLITYYSCLDPECRRILLEWGKTFLPKELNERLKL